MKWSRLLIVLCLLVVVGLHLIVVIQRNTTRANAKSSQLGRSQWVIGVWDGREDRDIGELLKWLVPLAVNNLLAMPHNLKALIHHIQTLISVPTCGKDTLEHLQDARVGSRSGGGTTTAGSVRRSSRRTSTRSPWILGHCRTKRVMTHIFVELLLCDRLNYKLNIWSKATWSERVGGYVSYLIHNALEDIKAHRLHESIQQVPLISRNSLWIANPRCQGPPPHPMQHKKVRKQPLNLGRLKTIILDVHGSHLHRHHDPSRVKLLGDVQLRRQPKNLSKLS
jgi:hypothetical protein